MVVAPDLLVCCMRVVCVHAAMPSDAYPQGGLLGWPNSQGEGLTPKPVQYQGAPHYRLLPVTAADMG